MNKAKIKLFIICYPYSLLICVYRMLVGPVKNFVDGPSVCQFTCTSACVSISVNLSLFVRLSVCPSVRLYIRLSAHLLYPFVCPYIRIFFVCVRQSPHIYPSLRVYQSVSICPHAGICSSIRLSASVHPHESVRVPRWTTSRPASRLSRRLAACPWVRERLPDLPECGR